MPRREKRRVALINMERDVNLIEYIHPKMDILFVALNAPFNSNKNGHWFSNNLSFWNLLYRACVIIKPIRNKLQGDEKVFGDTSINYKNWKIGVTDLIRNIVETDSSMVEPQPQDVKRILNILKNNKVDKLCLMHSKVGKAFREYSGIYFNHHRYGKVGKYGTTDIYEVPFHNAPVTNKESYYSQLVNSKVEHQQENKTIPSLSKPKKQGAPLTKAEKSFILPKPGNSITEKDIEKGQLRITVDFKDYFPNQSQIVKIKYLGKNHSVGYTYKDGRSSLLKVGENFMSRMRVTPKTRLKVNVLDGKYVIN